MQVYYTPLALACTGGEVEVVQLLIDSGADLEMSNSGGTTALHLAVDSGSYDCVSMLLESGADANAKIFNNIDVLWFIALRPDSNPLLLDLLLENGYKLEAAGAAVDVALLEAAKNGNDNFIKRVLDLGAIPGYGALRGALWKGRIDLLELYVEHGVDFAVVSEEGDAIFTSVTPDNNPREVVEFFVKHGLHIDTAGNDGVTGLMVAADWSSPDLCRIFLEFGADPNLRDKSGMNALDHAIEFGFDDVKEVVSLLLDAGAEVKLKDDQGKDRFYNISPEILELLQDKSASNSKEKQQDD